MKTILAIAALALFGLMALPAVQTASAESGKTSLVLFYADWCPNCKILDPKLKEALSDIDQDKLSMVTFDYTDRERILASKDLAAAKGLTDLQKSYGAKTGFAVLADESGKEISVISSEDSAEIIHDKIVAAIATQG